MANSTSEIFLYYERNLCYNEIFAGNAFQLVNIKYVGSFSELPSRVNVRILEYMSSIMKNTTCSSFDRRQATAVLRSPSLPRVSFGHTIKFREHRITMAATV